LTFSKIGEGDVILVHI